MQLGVFIQDAVMRQAVCSPTATCAAEVLGWPQTLGLLLAPLQQLSTAFDWRVAEACLYCVK